MEFTLLFAVLTAYVSMLATGRALRGRVAAVKSPIDAMLGAASIGLLTGRLAAMISDGVNPLTNPFEILLVRAGVRTELAATVAVGTLLWMWRHHLPAWPDAVAPIALAGLAGWHGGCVWRGTCLGTVSHLPWAFPIDGSEITRHPVELYAAIALLASIPLVIRFGRRPWVATGLAVAAAGAVRLATQPLRPSLTGGPVGFYVVAVVTGIVLALAGRRIPLSQETTA